MKDGNRVSERILELTLEIISLLSGENYTIVKKPGRSDLMSDGPPGTRSPSPVPPPHSLTHERNREQKILELTNKMMSLLTGEVPVRCDDVTVYFSMEEWEYLEGHKELYRDVMMETQQPRGAPAGDVMDGAEKIQNSPYEISDREQTEDTSPEDEQMLVLLGDGGAPADDVSAPMDHIKEEYASDYAASGHIAPNVEICPECGLRLPNKSQLIIHLRNHTGEKQISCPDCEKKFVANSNLIRHRRLHTGEKPFSCPECGQRFTRKFSLVKHQRIHKGEKPFTCGECGKSFTGRGNFIIHMRIHTGEKPFSCSECGKCFRGRGNLGKHLRVHIGEKPFCCSTCGKCYKHRCALEAHVISHAGLCSTDLNEENVFSET